ncbi:MAG: hypothetical protein M1812_000039 [Candelaria pacifica]|nr:MAG: hypothetical protein M1812_000039 [Candelaria pacifica]
MNRIASQSWSEPAHQDPTTSIPTEDEFDAFLDLGDFHLNYPSYDPPVQDETSAEQDVENAMDTSMDSIEGLQQRQGYDGVTPHVPTSNISLLQTQILQQQQHQQQFMNDPRFHGQQVIPPTPTSLDLQGAAAAHYYQQMDSHSRAMLDHYQRRKEEGVEALNLPSMMVFTPLVSPAVTPLDAQFQLPEYTMPGAYFSPLTSPALEAQTYDGNRMYYTNIPISDNSVPPSPLDLNIDPALSNTGSYPSPARKTRRRPSASLRTTGRAVRQSPAMKPQRRKGTSTSSTNMKELNGIGEGNQATRKQCDIAPPAMLPVPFHQDASDADSISPEPLSTEMAPPPLPKPSAVGQPSRSATDVLHSKSETNGVNIELSPATPASLMRLQQQANKKGVVVQSPPLDEQISLPDEIGPVLEDMTLPEEASSTTPALPPIETRETDDQRTPTLSGKTTLKTAPPKITPVKVSNQCLPNSADPSPIVNGLNSPNETITSKRAEPRASARGAKKRSGTASVQVSPALRPRISPSIKPLLPEGSVSAETSALLLASKSNYQNILEGTHLPGVSYPEALSTNLSSKRTSHKIAEQGRRNRINTALQEIASLLPSTAGGSPSSGSGGDPAGINSGSAAQQSNSKASTVELAIDYIKVLRAELAETKGRLEVAEKKLEEG